MKLNIRRIIQLTATVIVIISCVIYGLYINEIIDFRLLSVGDLNPYGGWSALKSYFTDLSYRWRGFTRSIALTVGITAAALLMGRFFCGFLCPLGAMQDFFKHLGNKLKFKEIKFSHKPEIIKYIVLIVAMTLSILGMAYIISPFSPWLSYMNLFTDFNIQIGSFILLLTALISLWGRRMFCRYFCPLGAFQSLLYAIGPFKIKKSNCNCSFCLKDCPVEEQQRINESNELSPECVNCLKCINTCVKGTEGFQLKIINKSIKKNTYIIMSISIILASFVLLPLTRSNSAIQAINAVENVKDGLYQGSGIGFGGIMDVQVSINNKRITDIKVLKHGETSGYYEEVFRNMIYEIIDDQNLNPDTVSGATSTSRGFLNSVKDAVSKSIDNY